MHTGAVAAVHLAALAALAAGAAPDASAQVDVGVEELGGSVLATFTASGASLDGIIVWFEPNGATISGWAADPGWTVDADSEAVILRGNVLEDGEAVKLGIRITGDVPQVYWSASRGGAEVQRGWLLSPEKPDEPEARPGGETGQPDAEPDEPVPAILPASEFYTVPAKPAPGYAIRLVGSGFEPIRELDLSIGGNGVGQITTDASGGFVATRTVPDSLSGRVDFAVSDDADKTVSISIRLAEESLGSRTGGGLDVDPLEATYKRGDRISVSGTTSPLNALVLGIYGPGGEIVSFKTMTSIYNGSWSMPDGIIIPLDAPLGEYTATIDDGEQTAEIKWVVETSKVITLNPIRTIFQPGDAIVFNGTAMPGVDIDVILQDPGGAELALDSWTVGPDGLVSWQFATDPTSRKGTYTLMASQGAEREFVYAGLGTVVERPTLISLDKANYLSTETPNIVIAGMPGDGVVILVLDDSDLVVHRGNATLQQDGLAMYSLDIGKFSSGVYTAIVQSGTVQDNQEFGVGLSTSSSILEITVRADRNPGDTVRVTGTANGNVVLTIALIDPGGNAVQTVETLVDKTGMLNEQRLRIPLDAESGVWTVKATSGPNSDVVELLVVEKADDGLAVRVDDSRGKPTIIISGVVQEYVTVTISEGGAYVVEPQRAYVTNTGTGHLPWNIVVPGTYTITVEAGSESASYTYVYVR